MIVVRLELHSAITGEVTEIGTAIIANDGHSMSRQFGDYDVRVGRKPDAGDIRKVYKRPLRVGRVDQYPRLSLNVWRLVIRALRSAFPEEK